MTAFEATHRTRAEPAPGLRRGRLGRYFELPEWEWAGREPVGWWVRPGWREVLLNSEGLRLDEWCEQGRVTVVKSGPHRVVYRVDLPVGGIYIKHFLVSDLRSLWRQWFRRGKGRNEAKQAARLAAAGVPTITPIALGERRFRRFLYDNYLVTLAIPGTTSLDAFLEQSLPGLPGARQTRIRQRLAAALGALTARLHDAGFVHTDFHPGNLLIRLDSADQPQLVMIDLDALRRRPRLKPDEAIENLALLNHYFWIRSSRTDRHRFLRAYLEHRRGSTDEIAGLARAVERTTRVWAERLWRRWGRRCLGSNKYFETYKGRHAWAVAARDVDPATVARLLEDPDAPFGWPGTVLLKESRTATVAEVPLTVAGQAARVIYKRFHRKKLLDPHYTLFRPSRAWRAWQNGQHLASRGVATPRNLVVIGRSAVRRRWLPHQYCPHETYLVTLKAEPAVALYDYIARTLAGASPAERRAAIRRFVPVLGRLIRTLHERSLSHRDLKAANILIEGSPDAAEPRLSLIDLVGVRIEHPISRHHQVQNLARLHLSLAAVPGRTRTDSLRFLRMYLPCGQVARRDWKALWRAIEAAGRKKLDQNRRNNRKLS